MTETTASIFKKFSEITWFRKIHIKRFQPGPNVPEPSWRDISKYIIENGVKSINKTIAQDNYSYGSIILDNAQFEFKNVYGEMSDENNINSEFNGFQRHDSLIRITEGYVDRSDNTDRQNIEIVTFTGIIDDRQAETTVNYTEKFFAKDRLKLLDKVTLSDIGTTALSTMNELVHFIVNRTPFSDYVSISSGTSYINAGYNASSMDLTQYDEGDTALTILQNLATGHSIFYVDPTDDFFYFKAITPTATVQHAFTGKTERRLKIDKYMTGVDRVIEKWYWQDTSLNAVATTAKYNTSEIIDIKAITNTTQRQNMLNAIRNLTQTAKAHFIARMPFYPIVKLLDKVTINRKGLVPDDAFILGVGRFGKDKLRKAVGAVKLSPSTEYFIRGIKHAGKLETELQLQEV